MVIRHYPASGFHQTIAGPRCVVNREPLVFADDAVSASFQLETVGVLFFALVEIPEFVNGVTAILSIENKNDDEIYRSSNLSANTKNKINVCSEGNDVPLLEINTIKLTLSGVPGGDGGTAYITLYTI